MAEKQRICKDCLMLDADGVRGSRNYPRPAPHPGPRCATHHRAKRKETSKRAHGRRVEAVYGISEERYWELYELQGGRCAWCRRGQGKSRRLAVDHDHACCPGKTSCGECVRGLLCGLCNDGMAHARDQVDHFTKAILYLAYPPAQRPETWKLHMAVIERNPT